MNGDNTVHHHGRNWGICSARKLKSEEATKRGFPSLLPFPLPAKLFHLVFELRNNDCEILDSGQLIPDRCGELSRNPVCRDADRLLDVLEGILDDGALVTFTEQQTNSGLVPLCPQNAINCREIEVQLARVFRFELAYFEFNDEVAVEPNMVEKQVKVEGFVSYGKRYLAAHEGKSPAELKQKIAHVYQQTALELSFLDWMR